MIDYTASPTGRVKRFNLRLSLLSDSSLARGAGGNYETLLVSLLLVKPLPHRVINNTHRTWQNRKRPCKCKRVFRFHGLRLALHCYISRRILDRTRPPNSLVALEMITSLIFQLILQLGIQTAVFFIVRQQCWYTSLTPAEGELCVAVVCCCLRRGLLGRLIIASSSCNQFLTSVSIGSGGCVDGRVRTDKHLLQNRAWAFSLSLVKMRIMRLHCRIESRHISMTCHARLTHR